MRPKPVFGYYTELLPDWSWVGRDRQMVWHILKNLELDTGDTTTYCGSSVLNSRPGRTLPERANVCFECLCLAKDPRRREIRAKEHQAWMDLHKEDA